MSYLFNSILFRNDSFDTSGIQRTFLWMRSGFHPQALDPKRIYAKEEFLLAPVNSEVSAVFYFVYRVNADGPDFYDAFRWMYTENMLSIISNASRQSRSDYRFYGFFHNNRSGPLDVGMRFENKGYEIRYLDGLSALAQRVEGGKIVYEKEETLVPDYSPFEKEGGVDEAGIEKYFNELKKPYDGRVFVCEELGISYPEITKALHRAIDERNVLFEF
ncbi:MAG TPA: hypothetical protein VI112_02740 [Bacteroidia bacterium]